MVEGERTMNDFDRPLSKGYGTLAWTRRGFTDNDKPSALLGRLIGLYDYKMDFRTDLERVAGNLTDRMNAFRTMAIWVDENLKRVRNAWASICSDYPGKGKADTADPSVTVEKLQYWKNFEIRCLEAADILRLHALPMWNMDSKAMAKDMGFPFKELDLILRWAVLPGDDVQMIARHAKSILETFEIPPTKEDFIAIWKKDEDKLLDYPKNKRGNIQL